MNRPRILAVTYGSYHAIRMLIGVYHAIFLMSMGVTLSQLALLQIAFSITVLLFDFPCAVLADRYRRKYSVTAGVFMTGVFYLLCLQAPNITVLMIAQILYAAGICFITSAVDGWIYHSLDHKQDRFSYYAHLSHQINSFGSIISGMIGIATIYYSGQYFMGYIISSLMMGIIFCIFLIVPEKKAFVGNGTKTKTILQNAKETLWIFQNTVGGAWFILLMCLFSAGIQVIYHFWQPIMLSGRKIDHLNNSQLLVLMFCHIGAFSAQYFSNALMSKYHVLDKKYKNSIKYFSFFSALMCMALYFFVHSSQIAASVIAFSLIHGFICTVPIGAKSLFFSELNQQQTRHISGIVGATSFSGRIFSIAALSVISFLPATIPPSYYLVLPTLTFFICGLVIIKWMTFSGKSILQKTI
ncbi:MFS transporter [Bartonella machadoae]|uniref:MFS transporter n=1 Tax=Bartonella machadoae TaxID=2893471 RepID=UPI001F4D3376|nr:MFS transporter [Bartonella machadoae]UNE55471.1 MFS transporter [Bartonella machadoae]